MAGSLTLTGTLVVGTVGQKHLTKLKVSKRWKKSLSHVSKNAFQKLKLPRNRSAAWTTSIFQDARKEIMYKA